MFVAFAVVSMLAAAMPASADCNYYQCRVTETGQATCYEFWCNSSGCNEADFLAEACPVFCDRGNTGGGCWCQPQGLCFEI
jgi:hypothetical protein